MTQMRFSEAINKALDIALERDPKTICYGLGVDDPKRIFGTTHQLQEKYGADRVFDMPISENAMTGIAIGAALAGYRSILSHQRLDFALLSMDQLVNNAAKWHFMFGGQQNVPITIRMIIGRGWGQGPTHSQNLQSWFYHIPGLKVVMPALPQDAGNLLLASIFDPNPVIFLEHRWLHNIEGVVTFSDQPVIGAINHIEQGNDVTLISSSYLTIEAIHAVNFLKNYNITCDHLDLNCLNPIDWQAIYKSVKKTGHVLICDTAVDQGAIAHDIISHILQHCWHDLKAKPEFLTSPNCCEPTSYALTKNYHVRSDHIALKIAEMCDINIDVTSLTQHKKNPHDIPGNWFTGSF